jgi:hypothetical protein
MIAKKTPLWPWIAVPTYVGVVALQINLQGSNRLGNERDRRCVRIPDGGR